MKKTPLLLGKFIKRLSFQNPSDNFKKDETRLSIPFRSLAMTLGLPTVVCSLGLFAAPFICSEIDQNFQGESTRKANSPKSVSLRSQGVSREDQEGGFRRSLGQPAAAQFVNKNKFYFGGTFASFEEVLGLSNPRQESRIDGTPSRWATLTFDGISERGGFDERKVPSARVQYYSVNPALESVTFTNQIAQVPALIFRRGEVEADLSTEAWRSNSSYNSSPDAIRDGIRDYFLTPVNDFLEHGKYRIYLGDKYLEGFRSSSTEIIIPRISSVGRGGTTLRQLQSAPIYRLITPMSSVAPTPAATSGNQTLGPAAHSSAIRQVLGYWTLETLGRGQTKIPAIYRSVIHDTGSSGKFGDFSALSLGQHRDGREQSVWRETYFIRGPQQIKRSKDNVSVSKSRSRTEPKTAKSFEVAMYQTKLLLVSTEESSNKTASLKISVIADFVLKDRNSDYSFSGFRIIFSEKENEAAEQLRHVKEYIELSLGRVLRTVESSFERDESHSYYQDFLFNPSASPFEVWMGSLISSNTELAAKGLRPQ